MSGQVQLFHGRTVPGPYTKQWRERWLRRLLQAQVSVRREGPPEFKNLQLITPEELHRIRRLWLYEKHEFDDSLPRIYEEVVGEPFIREDDDASGLRGDDWDLLHELCGDPAFFDLQVALLGVERQYRGMSRRSGVFDALEERLRTGLYASEQEAVAVLQEREERKKTWPLAVLDGDPRQSDLSADPPRKDEHE
jgi:DNA sulfur modification protein DndC